MTKIINRKSSPLNEDKIKKAISDIISWIGDDPTREALRETPSRVLKSYKELFMGYATDPKDILKKTFKNNYQYQDFILLKNISFISTCEHHMLPIVGRVNIAYIPNKKIVGISKLARLVEVFSRRLQIQENMTVQIAQTIQSCLKAKGVAVLIEAEHFCMAARGVNKQHTSMITSHFTDEFKENIQMQLKFLNYINQSK